MIGILKFINNLISNAIILVCVFLLLISGYCAYDNYYMFNTAVDKSLLVYRPEMEVMTEEKKITDKQVA